MSWLQHLLGSKEAQPLVPGEPCLLDGAFLADGGGAWRAFGRARELHLDGIPVVATPPLQSGQVLESGATCVRFLDHEPPPPLPRALAEAALADPFGWNVVADWLEDHGDDRALEVQGGPLHAVRRMGPLARHVHRGNLELTFEHGFPSRAVLRSLEREPWPSTGECLRRLADLDESLFLRELHVDLASASLTPDRLAFEVLARVRDLKLARLTLGPVARLYDERSVEHALAALPYEARLIRFSECLVGDMRITAAPQLAWFSGEPLAFTRTALGVWLVRPEGGYLPPVRVNGHPCVAARLLHGDVIELQSGVRVAVTVR